MTCAGNLLQGAKLEAGPEYHVQYLMAAGLPDLMTVEHDAFIGKVHFLPGE